MFHTQCVPRQASDTPSAWFYVRASETGGPDSSAALPRKCHLSGALALLRSDIFPPTLCCYLQLPNDVHVVGGVVLGSIGAARAAVQKHGGAGHLHCVPAAGARLQGTLRARAAQREPNPNETPTGLGQRPEQ